MMGRQLDPFAALCSDEPAPGEPDAGASAFAPTFVGRVFGNPTVPAQGGRFAWVRPVAISGAEVEGGPGVLTVDDGAAVSVLVLGTRAPATGEHLICRHVGHRWVAERMSTSRPAGVPTPGCPCATMPAALRMTSLTPDCNNGGFRSASLAWVPMPAGWSHLQMGSHLMLSEESFVDRSTGESFRYLFSCEPGTYTLRRVFPESIFGSPFVELVSYSWPFSLPGNSCAPFLLTNGRVSLGSDPSCVVTISE